MNEIAAADFGSDDEEKRFNSEGVLVFLNAAQWTSAQTGVYKIHNSLKDVFYWHYEDLSSWLYRLLCYNHSERRPLRCCCKIKAYYSDKPAA